MCWPAPQAWFPQEKPQEETREGVESCGGQTNSGPLTALAAMVPWLLLPLLLLWIQETQGSELKPNGRHVCKANRWIWESDGGRRLN